MSIKSSRLRIQIAAPPPFLGTLDLTAAQQDMVFRLTHDSAPAIFENEKISGKPLHELQQLTKSDRFDTVKAKSLAETHGKALAELVYLHTVIQAQIWALLSEEQRKHASKQMEHPRR